MYCRTIKATSLSVNVAIIYLTILVLEALLRYFLGLVNLDSIILIKDFLLILIIILSFYIRRVKLSDVIIFLIFIISLVNSILYHGSILQSIFGLKLLLPALAGYYFSEQLSKSEFYRFINYSKYLFFIASFGLILNYFISYPWDSITTEILGKEIDLSRTWEHVGGVKRLSGFSRASTNASIHISVLSISLYFFNVKYKKIWPIIFAFAIFVTFLTLSKAYIAGLIVVLVSASYYKKMGYLHYKISIVLLFIIYVLLTSYIFVYGYGENVSGVFYLIFSSIIVRFSETWPNAYDLILQDGNFLLGRGLGGIGTAQKYFEPLLYNPADNLLIYLFGFFGIVGVVFFFFIFYRTLNQKNVDNIKAWALSILLLVLLTGFTFAIIENPFISFYLGLAISIILRGKNAEVYSYNNYSWAFQRVETGNKFNTNSRL